jgi:hypothetical protein
MMLVDFGVNC